jgi:antitoxin VapB
MDIAKVFWSGRSQAVRLPKEFRFDCDQVRIRRRGDALILEPLARDWQWLNALTQKLDQDFLDAVNEEPAAQSSRRTRIGSIFTARNAGTKQAKKLAASKTAPAMARESGSVGVTP